MTGWGQYGSYSSMAGHDINYIGSSGVLGMIGRKDEKPVPPVNLIDFGGGMILALGMRCISRGCIGKGQVIDAVMTDGSAPSLPWCTPLKQWDMWGDRGTNLLDTGAPFYDVFECSDGKSHIDRVYRTKPFILNFFV